MGSTYREVFVVVMTVLAFAIPGNSFVDHTLNRNGISVDRKCELQALGFPTTRPTLSEEDADQQISSIDRRAVFLTGASVAAGYFLKEKIPSSNAPAILTTLNPSVGTDNIEASMISTVSSVEEALKIIETRGDKRFLHGVVASDYKFLYEQTKTIPSDIDVEQIFSKKVPPVKNKSRTVVLATTGNLGPKKSASLWPLQSAMTSNDIHYAWPEQGGALESNKKDDADVGVTQKMIVDGIDCGKMSLEDALEGEMQVLVQAPTYLSVPSYMESSLRKGLQGAFLI